MAVSGRDVASPKALTSLLVWLTELLSKSPSALPSTAWAAPVVVE
jgi:hypothetical protein